MPSNTISFDNIPGWVNWVAQDADGVWWGYQAEPNQSHRGWYENEVGDCIHIQDAPPNANWVLTLKCIK